jgi:hypothetical protein
MFVLVYSYNSCSYVCVYTHKNSVCSSVSPSCPVPPKRHFVKNGKYRIDLFLQRVFYIVGQSTAALSHIKPRKSIRVAVFSLRQKMKDNPCIQTTGHCVLISKTNHRVAEKINFYSCSEKTQLSADVRLCETL